MKKQSSSVSFSWPKIGIWVWGTILILLSAVIICTVFWGDMKAEDGLYKRMNGAAGLLGPIVAVVGVAWSWFYQIARKDDENKAVSEKLDTILASLDVDRGRRSEKTR